MKVGSKRSSKMVSEVFLSVSLHFIVLLKAKNTRICKKPLRHLQTRKFSKSCLTIRPWLCGKTNNPNRVSRFHYSTFFRFCVFFHWRTKQKNRSRWTKTTEGVSNTLLSTWAGQNALVNLDILSHKGIENKKMMPWEPGLQSFPAQMYNRRKL